MLLFSLPPLQDILLLTAFALSSYLLGSIPFAFLVGKSQKIDIRQHGSGNVGATNTLRVLGKGWGITVLLLDAGKAFAAVILCRFLLPEYLPLEAKWLYLPAMAGGFLAILGHIYPVWLKFKGGKGVACGLGVILGLAPQLVGFALALFILLVAITRYVSLGSIAAAASLPGFFFVFFQLPERLDLFIFLCLIAFFVIIKHKSNIVRLLEGKENKIFAKK